MAMRKRQAELSFSDFAYMDPELPPLHENVVEIEDVDREFEVFCLECGANSTISEDEDECPVCGGCDLDVA
jgi:Zn finger protein HypA/HybF involved in hydrogenase expression